VRSAICRILEREGHETFEAASGVEAMARFADTQPDLLITDVYMPGGDGIESLIRILADAPETRIIVMSGGGWAGTADVLADADRLGAAATLPKPFSVEDVQDTVRRVLAEAES